MSEHIEICGGIPLNGSAQVSGAKNAVLPMMIASLLSSEACDFENVPALQDVSITTCLLENLGAQVDYVADRVNVKVPALHATEASYSLVKAMRASFWVLGPLLARGRAAKVSLPGGDIIGARPVDMHLAGLARMGAEIQVKHGIVYATAPDGLRAARIDLRFPSVGATHQIMMAAALTPGTTVITGAAREPEVSALAAMLCQMGSEIEGAGSSQITVQGRESLGGARVRIIGDRIEAATYLLAAAASGGSVRVSGFAPSDLGAFLDVLAEMGLDLEQGPDWLGLRCRRELRAVRAATGPFPEFATDIQALLVAALSVAQGESRVEENVFDGRFGHVAELCRMGAQIKVEERVACISGPAKLTGAPVEAMDIRGAAALAIAALAAEGVSRIHEAHHLRRGYADLEGKLRALGARIGTKLVDPEDYAFTGC